MEVLSVNFNKCGGTCSNGKGEIYDSVIAVQAKNMINDFLEIEENNVVFINEINNVEDNFTSFKKLFDENVYSIHKPSNFESFNDSSHAQLQSRKKFQFRKNHPL